MVAPVLQLYVYGELPVLHAAVAVPSLFSLQITFVVVVPALTEGLTVTTAVEVEELPPVSLIVTVYVVVVAGQGLIF